MLQGFLLHPGFYWEKTREFLDEVGKLEIPYATDDDRRKRVLGMAGSQPDLKYVHARSRFFHNRPRLGETYIKQAYRKIAKQFHPDGAGRAPSSEKFREITEAYETLRDTEKRRAHDSALEQQVPSAPAVPVGPVTLGGHVAS